MLKNTKETNTWDSITYNISKVFQANDGYHSQILENIQFLILVKILSKSHDLCINKVCNSKVLKINERKMKMN